MSDGENQTDTAVTDVQAPLEPPVPSGVPYRAPPEQPAAFALPRVPRLVTLWAPALGIFGVLLWAFVVMGQLVTSYAPGKQGMLVGEGTGVLIVLCATSGAWVVAVRRSLSASPAKGGADRVARGFVLAMLPLVAWGATMMVASVFRTTSAGGDGAITLLLLGIAFAAVFYGQRLSAANAPARTERERVVGRVLWVGAAVLTFAALVALVAS